MTEHFDTPAMPATAYAARALFDLPADVLHLDCAARCPRLRSVLAAGRAALQADVAPWRLDEATWLASIERVRTRVAALLGDAADGVALVPSVAYALATAARNLPLARGDAVLVEDTSFPSNLLTWQQRSAEVGARLVVARRQPGSDATDAMLAAFDANPRIRIVAIAHAHWVDGALLDLDRIAARAQAAGAALVLDLSQSLGVLPVQIARWQPAFVVCVGYKWLLGPGGLAYLWAAPAWREHGHAIEQHWSARAPDDGWHFADDAPPPLRAGARHFDAGGVATSQALMMADAGMAQVQAWGSDHIASRLGALTATLDAALDAHGLGAWTASRRAPHLMGLLPPSDCLDRAVAALRAGGILCTARYGHLRIAPHLHVDDADMQRVANVLASVRG